MSRIKATLRFLHAWRHPEQIAREVEEELRFHIEKRTAANLETGMTTDEARVAARRSFGDLQRFKNECCEISRSLPFDSTVWKMAMYISIAVLAGWTALWAVNVPHHNLSGVLWELIAIVVLARSFVVGRRAISTEQFQRNRESIIFVADGEKFREENGLLSVVSETHNEGIAKCDEEARTPVERLLN
ncbi:MAG TPA: permease prefix domain 1-containing protein [Pyrinomonadaceae bacterium]|nr:permease prefix domain 1-containing protein [Pyrinomonadaceae bacterium]